MPVVSGLVSTVRPSGTGASGSKRRTGRPFLQDGLRARVCYVAAPATGPDALRARIRRCRLPASCSDVDRWLEGGSMRRCIGLDVHREFAEVAIWEDGVVRLAGQIATTPEALRRQVARRALIVRQRTRLKNRVQSILHRNLVPRCPAADLFGHKGRAWLAAQDLPQDEHQAVAAL